MPPPTKSELLRRLGMKMLAEIDLLLRRNAEERAKLLQAQDRLAELDVEDTVLNEERAALIARGQPRETPANDTGIGQRGSRVP